MALAALTLAEFVDRFPEFSDVVTNKPVMVQARLDEAWRRTPAGIWGDQAQDAHGYLAAHLLEVSGFGRDARLKSDDTQTTYGATRARMDAELGPAVAPRTARGSC